MRKILTLLIFFMELTASASLSGNGLFDLQNHPLTTNQTTGIPRNPLDTEILVSGSIVDPRARTWSLLNSTDSVNAVQSGAWSTGRTWTLLNSTDSVNAVQSGSWSTGRTWTLSSGTDSVAATQSGTWNLNNITGTVSLPTGASTAAKQPALGTAGTASSDVITVQGIASMTPIAVTQSTSPWVTSATQSGSWTVQQGTPPWSVSQSGSWTTGRTWTLSNATDSVASVQSGSWTTGRTWTLGSGTDSVTSIQGTSPWVSNVTQFGSVNLSTGTGASGTGIPRVTVSNDSQIKIWDGTNQATVKAASTATLSTDTAVVVGFSPNSNQVQGTVANSSSDSGNPVKVGGVFRSSTPVYSDGARADLQLNIHGGNSIDSSSTDLNSTLTTTGTTAAFDASGFASIAFTATVTAASGTAPTLDVQLQESEDGVNDWNEEYDADRFITTGSYKSIRQSLHARYYRYRYVIGGTTPSFTFTIRTTLKVSSAPIVHAYNRFNDLVMTTANNFSSIADLEGCSFWSATLTRGAGGAGVTIVNQVSNDGVNWILGTSTNSSASTSYLISNTPGSTTKYARFTNTNNQAAATTLDIKWYCKE